MDRENINEILNFDLPQIRRISTIDRNLTELLLDEKNYGNVSTRR